MAITAHCLVKNEENYILYAISSIVDFVDHVIVFDTGSTDKTVEIIEKLVKQYPDKIFFEEKGLCDGATHTLLRQEMLQRTTTSWFMILDGDEVWTKNGMAEVKGIIENDPKVDALVNPYYLCVGDVYHYSARGKYKYGNQRINALPRFFRKKPDVMWNPGLYGGGDYIKDSKGDVIASGNYLITKNKYWHTTSLVRSSKDDEVALGRHKQVISYSLKLFGEGFRIKEPVPEVMRDALKLPWFRSFVNACLLVLYGMKILRKRIWI